MLKEIYFYFNISIIKNKRGIIWLIVDVKDYFVCVCVCVCRYLRIINMIKTIQLIISITFLKREDALVGLSLFFKLSVGSEVILFTQFKTERCLKILDLS